MIKDKIDGLAFNTDHIRKSMTEQSKIIADMGSHIIELEDELDDLQQTPTGHH